MVRLSGLRVPTGLLPTSVTGVTVACCLPLLVVDYGLVLNVALPTSWRSLTPLADLYGGPLPACRDDDIPVWDWWTAAQHGLFPVLNPVTSSHAREHAPHVRTCPLPAELPRRPTTRTTHTFLLQAFLLQFHSPHCYTFLHGNAYHTPPLFARVRANLRRDGRACCSAGALTDMPLLPPPFLFPRSVRRLYLCALRGIYRWNARIGLVWWNVTWQVRQVSFGTNGGQRRPHACVRFCWRVCVRR